MAKAPPAIFGLYSQPFVWGDDFYCVDKLDYEADINEMRKGLYYAAKTPDDSKHACRRTRIVCRAATKFSLNTALCSGAPVLLLCSHGTHGFIALEDDAKRGHTEELLVQTATAGDDSRPTGFRDMVRGNPSATGKTPLIAVLGACYSEGAAHELCAAGVPFVVASTTSELDVDLRQFQRLFIRGLFSPPSPGSMRDPTEFVRSCFNRAVDERFGRKRNMRLVSWQDEPVKQLCALRQMPVLKPPCKEFFDRLKTCLIESSEPRVEVDSQLDHQPWFVPGALQLDNMQHLQRERLLYRANARGMAAVYSLLSHRDDAPGRCVGIVGWPRTGTTSIAMAIARHARWRDHFSGGVFFVPVGDISVAACLEELPPDGDLEPWELEVSSAPSPSGPSSGAGSGGPGSTVEASDPMPSPATPGCAGGGAAEADSPTDFWEAQRHRLLRRLKACICAGILRHLHRQQSVGIFKDATGEWPARYHRIRACRNADEVGKELYSWKHVLVVLDGMDAWLDLKEAVEARQARFTAPDRPSCSRYPRREKAEQAASRHSRGGQPMPVTTSSSQAASGASGHQIEAGTQDLWPPNWAGNTDSLPVAELLIALSGEKGKIGGTSVLYTAKVGSLLGRKEVDKSLADARQHWYVACGLMPRGLLSKASSSGSYKYSYIDKELVDGCLSRHLDREGAEEGCVSGADGHCWCAPVCLRRLEKRLGTSSIDEMMTTPRIRKDRSLPVPHPETSGRGDHEQQLADWDWDLDTGSYVDIERRRSEVEQWMRAEGDVGDTSFDRIWRDAVARYHRAEPTSRHISPALVASSSASGAEAAPGSRPAVVARHVLEATLAECMRVVGDPAKECWVLSGRSNEGRSDDVDEGSIDDAAEGSIEEETYTRTALVDMVHLYKSCLPEDSASVEQILQPYGARSGLGPPRIMPWDWQTFWFRLEPAVRASGRYPQLWSYRLTNPGAFFPFASSASAAKLLGYHPKAGVRCLLLRLSTGTTGAKAIPVTVSGSGSGGGSSKGCIIAESNGGSEPIALQEQGGQLVQVTSSGDIKQANVALADAFGGDLYCQKRGADPANTGLLWEGLESAEKLIHALSNGARKVGST